MKKIIEFFKSLFFKLEYVPTGYNVTVDEQPEVEVKKVKQVKKKAVKKPTAKKNALKKMETKKPATKTAKKKK
jgi:hypothetical protein